MRSPSSVPVEEYLATDYSPDVDYVDGVIEERNVGERPRSFVQRRLILSLSSYPGLHVWPEQRVQVQGTRWRVPDICVTLSDPKTDTFTSPPFLCIEILSSEDTMNRTVRKLQDYQDFGVPHIWLFDPWNRKTCTYSSSGLVEAGSGLLTTVDPAIAIDAVKLFEALA